MWHYTGLDAMRRPLKLLIRCCQNSRSPRTSVFVVGHFLHFSQDHTVLTPTIELRRRYVDARPVIRRIIDTTLSRVPRFFIDTTTNRQLDRKQQAEAFETLPIFNELVSSMTIELDDVRIQREVKQFYRYMVISRKWEAVHGYTK